MVSLLLHACTSMLALLVVIPMQQFHGTGEGGPVEFNSSINLGNNFGNNSFVKYVTIEIFT